MERTPDPRCPQLLVSVRSAAEAHEALAGGCDILDVKEPRHGSLGAATESVIREVSDIGRGSGVPVSAALGECLDWQSIERPLNPKTILEAGLRFVKIGLAGMGDRDDWSAKWHDLTGWCGRQLGPGTRHVAVVYADWQAARAPHPQSILEALSEHIQSRHIHSGQIHSGQIHSGRADAAFAGVLIDTFEKSSGRLLDAMSLPALREIREQTSQLGLFLALAGRLNEESLPPLVELAPDIVAVRSAACRGEDRNASVDRGAVSQFRAAIQSHFEPLVKTAAAGTEAGHA
jgi:uncharacterized protein (UPF0264 family)